MDVFELSVVSVVFQFSAELNWMFIFLVGKSLKIRKYFEYCGLLDRDI